MNRLQKKCFVVSALVHSLAFGCLLFGPLVWSSSPRSNDLPVLKVIPGKLIDEILYGGGGTTAPKVPPPAERETPPPTPAPSEPEPVRPLPKPAQPVQPDPKTTEQSRQAVDEVAPPVVKKKGQVIPDFTRVERGSKSQPASRKSPSTQAKAQNAWSNQVNSSLDKLRGGLSGSTSVETVGPGGEAYANYEQVVKSIYTEAWHTPDDVTDETANVLVQITIMRDGNVLSSEILNPSGIASLDKSVRSVLERVRYVRPFPEGANETQRSFKLNFNLKAKRLVG